MRMTRYVCVCGLINGWGVGVEWRHTGVASAPCYMMSLRPEPILACTHTPHSQVCEELAATIIENGVVRQATPEELAKAKVRSAPPAQQKQQPCGGSVLRRCGCAVARRASWGGGVEAEDGCCVEAPSPNTSALPLHAMDAEKWAGRRKCPAAHWSAAQSKGLSAACLMEEYLDGPEVDVDLVFSQGEPVSITLHINCAMCCCRGLTRRGSS